MKNVLLLLVLCSGLVYGQSPYSYGGESERDRIAREHQSGGIYNPNNPSGGGGYSMPKVWGAIAIDYKTFKGSGYSNSEKSQKDAEKKAIKFCKEHSKNCNIVLTYGWNNCGAVAASTNPVDAVKGTYIWAAETRQLRADADTAALKSCNMKLKAEGIKGNCSLWMPAKCALFGGS
ncbi:DUF4189 domain-containing protein [Neisseria sp. Ec49-e6-T10]|uniref:DUF4189 domain-containing protein n=1 Tax=Neisseria sp. Ec49-e6-T10 TaxID=3140744 RepID=UPI003EBBC3A1